MPSPRATRETSSTRSLPDTRRRERGAPAADLRARPVWLFSSGPVGDPPRPAEDPKDVPALAETVGAYGHRVFAGRLHRQELGVFERLVAAAMGAKDGDYRDWPSIRAWAVGIGAILAHRENVPLGRVAQHRA